MQKPSVKINNKTKKIINGKEVQTIPQSQPYEPPTWKCGMQIRPRMMTRVNKKEKDNG